MKWSKSNAIDPSSNPCKSKQWNPSTTAWAWRSGNLKKKSNKLRSNHQPTTITIATTGGIGRRRYRKLKCEGENSDSKFVLRKQVSGFKTFPESTIAMLYKRTSEERRKGNPSIPNNFSLYTYHLLLSNYVPWFNVQSESSRIILHTTNWSLRDTASAKVQIDYRLRYAYTRTRAAHSKLPVDPCATRSL